MVQKSFKKISSIHKMYQNIAIYFEIVTWDKKVLCHHNGKR